MIDSAANGTPFRNGPVPASADATACAGAVLDACTLLNAKLPRHDDTQIFWMRVGRLAFRAAEEAHAAGRLQESTTLVFAGPDRWQGEGYWYMYPDHDALAAVILAKSGRRNEALARLQNRVELKGPAEVFDTAIALLFLRPPTPKRRKPFKLRKASIREDGFAPGFQGTWERIHECAYEDPRV